MIRSKQDYLDYLDADRLALAIRRARPRWFGDDIWKFQRLLRKFEYYLNCKSGLWRLYRYLLRHQFRRASIRLGLFIPPNTCGPGLSIAHYGSITIHPAVRIGGNCRLNICTNIGTAAGESDAVPVIGHNVFIGPGAMIFGRIEIANDVVIGANSVVTRSITEPGITVAGAPARKISDRGRRDISALELYRHETTRPDVAAETRQAMPADSITTPRNPSAATLNQ